MRLKRLDRRVLKVVSSKKNPFLVFLEFIMSVERMTLHITIYINRE